jgi:hypothetical protein
MRVRVYYPPMAFFLPVIGFLAILIQILSGRAFQSDLGRLQEHHYCSTEQICVELGYLSEYGTITTKGRNAIH